MWSSRLLENPSIKVPKKLLFFFFGGGGEAEAMAIDYKEESACKRGLLFKAYLNVIVERFHLTYPRIEIN